MTQVRLWEHSLGRASLYAEEPCIKSGADVIQFQRGTGPYTTANEPIVLRDGVPMEQRLALHSPTGFEWGYAGSGPADLALNILYLYVDFPRALKHHQAFKESFVANIPKSGGVLMREQVMAWLRTRE